MRLLLTSFFILSCALAAHADYVVERKVTTGSDIRPMVLKFKGDRARIELPLPENRKIVLLLDVAKDEIQNLIPDVRKGFRGKLSERRASREKALQSHGIRPGVYAPTKTGQTKTIAGYKAEEYVVGAVGLQIWVAPDFPNWQPIQAQLARFSEAQSGGALSPDCMGLPGLVVETRHPGERGVEVTTLESAREANVPESDLVVPEGFEMTPFPQPVYSSTGGQPAATPAPQK